MIDYIDIRLNEGEMANPNDTYNLAEHVGALLTLLWISAGIAGYFFWHLFSRMESKMDDVEKKIDEWMDEHVKCRVWQRDNFLLRSDWKDWVNKWEPGRKEIWDAINNHGHSASGKVERSG